MEEQCRANPETYFLGYQSIEDVDVLCLRDKGHKGKHWFSIKLPGKAYVPEMIWDAQSSTLRHNPATKVLWNECDECGLLIEDNWVHCQDCQVWVGILERTDPEKRIITDGVLYLYDPELRMSPAGAEVTVLWFDHSRPALVSKQIKKVSKINADFRDRLPDNAQFKLLQSQNGKYYFPFGRTLHNREVAGVLAGYDRLD